MSKSQFKTYNGELAYNNNAEYELSTPGGIVNISQLLDSIYYADNNHIEIKIMEGCKILFDESGFLLLKKDKSNIYSYHVAGEPLEEKLFNNTDKILEITIFAEALGDTYGTSQSK